MNWEDKICFFDFEVFAHDWLVVFKDRATGTIDYFRNDNQGVRQYINEHDYIYCGYNNKSYDNYILRGVIEDFTPERIKEISDYIIEGGHQGWTYPFTGFTRIPPTTDLMLDVVPRMGLKAIEGNLGMNIVESSVPFDLPTEWTDDEYKEILLYCIHDVEALEPLFSKRLEYLTSKVVVSEMASLDVSKGLYSTNAQLSAKYLNAAMVARNDHREFEYPDVLDYSYVPQEVLDFFAKLKDETITDDDLKGSKLYTDLYGVEHVYGFGGIHGSLCNYREETTDTRTILNFDFASLYPNIMINFDAASRSIGEADAYRQLVAKRLAAKAAGDKKTANSLKLVINTSYGAMLNQYNPLYDPKMGKRVCIVGQLIMTEYVGRLAEIPTIKVINVNTDGVMFSIDNEYIEQTREIARLMEKKTNIELEEDKVQVVVMKDVNNYVMLDGDGEVKFKGAYVNTYSNYKNHDTKKYDDTFRLNEFRNGTMSVVAKAVLEYFLYGKSIEETINNETNPLAFQMIGKMGRTYDRMIHIINNEPIETQTTNRIYAVKDTTYGSLYKEKRIELEQDEGGYYYINGKGNKTYKKKATDSFIIQVDKLASCPEHAFVDNNNQITIDKLDKVWYTNIAMKKVDDFLGTNHTNKKGEKKLEETDVKETKTKKAKVEVEPKIKLAKKIFELGEFLRQYKYTIDGYNSNQKYEYTKAVQYRQALGEGCSSLGLLFKLNIGRREFIELSKSASMNLTTIVGAIVLTDIDTGESDSYMVIADGTDNLDKGIYKAETMLIKSFVKNNFLLPSGNDEVDAEADANTGLAMNFTKPETRAEAKAQVVNEGPSVEEVTRMSDLIERIRTKEPDYGTSTLAKLKSGTMTKLFYVQAIIKIEDKATELGV